MLQVLIEAAWRYSERLSRRSKSGKQYARDKGTKYANCPDWLKLNKQTGQYERNQPYYDLLYAAIKMAIDGHGATSIGRKMPELTNWRNLPKIFRQRSLIGEWKCHFCEGKNWKKRRPTGEIKENFYPPMLTLVEWNQLQESLDSRKKVHAKNGKRGVTSLFSMLVNEKNDKLWIRQVQRTMGANLTNSGSSGYVPHLVSKKALNDPSTRFRKSFNLIHYPTVEMCLLFMLSKHVTPAMLNPTQAKADSDADKVSAKIIDNKRKIATLSALLENNPSEAVFSTVVKMETENKKLKSELDALRQKASHNQAADLASAHDLMDVMKEQTGEQLTETRIRLKYLIGTIVDKVVVERTGNDTSTLSFVVTLKSGVTLTGDGTKWKAKNTITIWQEKTA